MAIRLVRPVLTDGDVIDIPAWNAQVAMDLPVGLCNCRTDRWGRPASLAYGEPLRDPSWVNIRCGTCGTEAARPLPTGMATAG